MANRTDPDAKSVHGTNPQNLIEKILRMKIYSSMYWKEHCFALTAESLVDKAVELKFVGGTYGGQRAPTQFMCLMLKLLQLQPEKEIIVEFIRNEDYKYVRILGAFYLRLVGRPLEVYQYLEPLYNDYRKVRLRNADGNFALTYIDELVDQMLNNEYLFDVALPRIPNRVTMERLGQLPKRISVLEEDFDEDQLEAEAGNAAAAAAAAALEAEMAEEGGYPVRERSPSPDREKRKREKWRRSRSRERKREKEKERDRERDRDRERERDGERHRHRDRDRERDADRERGHGDRDRGRRASYQPDIPYEQITLPLVILPDPNIPRLPRMLHAWALLQQMLVADILTICWDLTTHTGDGPTLFLPFDAALFTSTVAACVIGRFGSLCVSIPGNVSGSAMGTARGAGRKRRGAARRSAETVTA